VEVRVVPPDPNWEKESVREAALIRDAIDDDDVELHHIGSTAIRGIFAKPIIDILLLAPRIESLDLKASAMVVLGYECMGEFGIAGRRYFRKDSPKGVRTHQVHAFARGSHHAERHLAFRDYMNAHPAIALHYSSLKQRLASAFPGDLEQYMDDKDTFVKHHETLALAWSSKRRGA
jgi:GrpB-like predicted nucleotidyltransferase (UPF0157 family)